MSLTVNAYPLHWRLETSTVLTCSQFIFSSIKWKHSSQVITEPFLCSQTQFLPANNFRKFERQASHLWNFCLIWLLFIHFWCTSLLRLGSQTCPNSSHFIQLGVLLTLNVSVSNVAINLWLISDFSLKRSSNFKIW